jgi:Outer membrane protein beta-barrel domain
VDYEEIPMSRNVWILVAAMLVLAGVPGRAAAQAFGIGPRFSFVRGDAVATTPADRFMGGTMRMRTSPRVALEVAMDFRARQNEEGTLRVREVPVQGSLLLFFSKSVFRPYVLGGMGMYTEFTDQLSGAGLVVETTRTRKTGIHLGMGAEIFLSRHAALFADYRFRFVKFGGEPDPDSQAINIPGSSFIPGLDNVKLSHHGSMWTGGMAFYF